MWVVCVRNKRLLISNEVDEKGTPNGILIKKFSSGGDRASGRINNGLPFEFVPQFSLMFMCNDFKEPDPIDTLDNCVQFVYKSKFVEKEKLIEGQPFLKLKNVNIKDILQQNNIIDAFTLYILDHYANDMEMPNSVKASCAVLKEDKPVDLEDVILKYFRNTPNKDDKMFSDDILQKIAIILDEPIQPKEVSAMLLKCSIGVRSENGNIRIDKIQKKGYTNIKYIEPIDDE
jgi:hypothetical protein